MPAVLVPDGKGGYKSVPDQGPDSAQANQAIGQAQNPNPAYDPNQSGAGNPQLGSSGSAQLLGSDLTAGIGAVQPSGSGNPYAPNSGYTAQGNNPLSSTTGIPTSLIDPGGIFSPSPNNYDANGNLISSEGLAQGVYGAAGSQYNLMASGLSKAPTAQINAQTIGTPQAITAQTVATPNAIQAQNVNAPAPIQAQTAQASDLVQGQDATALRAQQLSQAQAAANSPSSAAAQMKAAGGQIQNQQLGQAAMARGPDRAAAARTAMLATGTQGMGAAQSTSALAAQEQAAKQQAYTQALSGVRAGDVSGAQAQQQITLANQQAGLQAQTTTGQQSLAAQTTNQAAGLQAQTTTEAQALAAGQTNQAANLQAQGLTQQGTLTAAQANQGANLTAQQATIQNQQAGYFGQQQAQNAYLGTELGAVGGQNQAQGVAASYGTGQNTLQQTKQGGVVSLVGNAISDEKAKTDITPIGGALSPGTGADDFSSYYKSDEPTPLGGSQPYSGLLADAYQLPKTGASPTSPYGMTPTEQRLLDWQMPAAQQNQSNSSSSKSGSGIMGLVDMISDERAKQDAASLSPAEVADWAEEVPTGIFRYKPGTPGTDNGAAYHAGTFATALQQTGPLGKLMVHRRPDGLKEVEYGPLGLMTAKGALTKADQALKLAEASYAMAAGKKGAYHG